MKKFASEDQIPPVREDAAHMLMDILNGQQIQLKNEGSPNIIKLVEEANKSKDPLVERLISKLIEMYRFNEQLGITTGEIQRATKLTIEQNKDMHAEVHRCQIQKETLESLCREMEKKWRAAEEENNKLLVEESEKRREMERQFHQLVAGMKTTMEKEFQSIIRSRSGLRIKFKSFLEEYYTREKHYNAVCKTKDSEYALLQAKYDLLLHKINNSCSDCARNPNNNTQDIPASSRISKNSKNESMQSQADMSSDQFQSCQTQLQTMVQQLELIQGQQQKESAGLHKLLEERGKKLSESEETIAKLELKCIKLENLCRALQEKLKDKNR